ncbi:MAG: FtsX-like permease family protein [Acidobacteriaceae bacterium]
MSKREPGGFPVAHVRTMDEVVVQSTTRQDFNMLLLSIFGACALILGAIGIYGPTAYSIQQRTHEMGIRMALDADRAKICNLVVRQGVTLAVIGVLIGIAASFGLTYLIASFLYGSHHGPRSSSLVVPIVLAAVALAATWIPAHRASRLGPVEALRVE